MNTSRRPARQADHRAGRDSWEGPRGPDDRAWSARLDAQSLIHPGTGEPVMVAGALGNVHRMSRAEEDAWEARRLAG